MWGIKFIKYSLQRKQIDSHKVCSKYPPLARTQARKRAGHWSTASSISKCSKLCHTHSRPVAAHQCHELWIPTHVTECLQKAFIPVSRFVKDIKIHQDFPELWSQMCCHVFLNSKSALLVLLVWNVIVSFSQGSVNTLFRWGGYIFQVCVKRFFLLTAVQKLFKSTVFVQSYDHKCIDTFFRFTV